MKCEHCSRIVKPVVVSDIDGTLGDYHIHLCRFVVNYFHLTEGEFHAGRMWDGTGKLYQAIGISKPDYEEAKLAFRQGGMKRTMPLFHDGGPELLREMKELDCDIWYATTRPWQRLDNVDPDTRFWLEKVVGLPVDGLMFDIGDKYGRLCRDHLDQSRIIGVLEDLPEQYDRAWELGLPVIQVARRHNSAPGASRPLRLDMAHARATLLAGLKTWKEGTNG